MPKASNVHAMMRTETQPLGQTARPAEKTRPENETRPAAR